MSVRALVSVLLLAIALAVPASAISITNLDEKDYKVTIVEGDKSASHQIKAAQVLEGVCLKGCLIVVDDGEEQYVLKEGETNAVVIQEGELYYDGPVPGDQPAPGAGQGSGQGGGQAPPAGKADPKGGPANAPPAGNPPGQNAPGQNAPGPNPPGPNPPGQVPPAEPKKN